MDHIVYLDVKANELENLLAKTKIMIIRGATGRKLPYGRVNCGDTLYFMNNNGERVVKAKAEVKSVFNSEKKDKEESIQLVSNNQSRLQLTEKQFKHWAGKRYIVLIEVRNVEEVEPFTIDKSNFGNMDDWLPVEQIEKVKI